MPGCVTAAGSAACACKSQLASLLACQMPLKFGLPPTVAGRAGVAGAGAPDVCVTDKVMTALTAAAATATAIMERKNRSLMVASFQWMLLKRILFDADKIGGDVFCCRVGAFACRERGLFRARS